MINPNYEEWLAQCNAFKNTYNIENLRQSGSRCIPGASSDSSDFDVFCLSRDLPRTVDTLLADGWSDCNDTGEEYPDIPEDGMFICRYGKLNLMVFGTEDAYDRFAQAQRIAEELVLTNKADRVTLFREICGN